MRKIILLSAVVFAASCSATKKTVPTEADAQRGAQQYNGYTLAMMNSDKAIWADKCSNCHPTINPKLKKPEKWSKIVARMVKKASRHPKKVITPQEQEAITRFVVTMSTAKRGK